MKVKLRHLEKDNIHWYDKLVENTSAFILRKILYQTAHPIYNQDYFLQEFVKKEIREHCNS